MQVTVKLFAILRDRAGTAEIALELAAGATISTAATEVARIKPEIQDVLSRIAFAVNREYVKQNHVLHDGDELALIPPVSGG